VVALVGARRRLERAALQQTSSSGNFANATFRLPIAEAAEQTKTARQQAGRVEASFKNRRRYSSPAFLRTS
jgi:hypothetical protein